MTSTTESKKRSSISLSTAFLILTVTGIASYTIGHVFSKEILQQLLPSTDIIVTTSTSATSTRRDMPNIAMPKGKIAPDSRYTAQVFGDARAEEMDDGSDSSSSGAASIIHHATLPVTSHNQLIEIYRNNRTTTAEKEVEVDVNGESMAWNDGEIHHPVGQHLLVDLKNVDPGFLASEERIARAIIQLVEVSGLTLLSYHCSRLESTGVSCIGVLLESHVAVHSQTRAGTVNIDLFTCGEGALVPHLPLIRELFAVKSEDPQGNLTASSSNTEVFMKWSHKKRGFPLPGFRTDPRQVDLREYLLGSKRFEKHHLTTVKSQYQEIDIYDVIDYHRSDPKLREASTDKDSGSYESRNAELYMPERRVYLNSILKSRDFGEASYHEMLVHPVMFVHENPQTVAIIGGGEGAVLREVLKHNSVKKVVMIEIDAQVVETAREFLHDWNDCSNIEGSTTFCFDDPRVELFYADATAWFADQFKEGEGMQNFDVIIMDAVDPDSSREISNKLYNNPAFVEAMSKSLGAEGILVAQMGKADQPNAAPDGMRADTSILNFIEHLEDAAFVKVIDYTEGHGRLTHPLRYMVALKDEDALADWKRNEAEIQLDIHRRLRRSVNGEGLLRYFDGPSFVAIQNPDRIFENVYCRRNPAPDTCAEVGHGWDPRIPNFPFSALEVRSSQLGDIVGRGVFAKERIPQGSYLALEGRSHTLLIPPSAHRLLYETLRVSGLHYLDVLGPGYIEGYGWSHHYYVSSIFLDSGRLCFFCSTVLIVSNI